MTPTFELVIDESSRMEDEEYPARSARSSQSLRGKSRLRCPGPSGLLLDDKLSGPNPRLSSEASGIRSLVRSPTINENEPSPEVMVCLWLDPLQTRSTATGVGGAMPVSRTTLP